MLRKSFSHDGTQVDGGMKSKALSGRFNLGRNERYTLGREWGLFGWRLTLVCGTGSHSAPTEYAYAKAAHAMNYRLMMEERCGGSSPYRKASMKKLHVSHKKLTHMPGKLHRWNCIVAGR